MKKLFIPILLSLLLVSVGACTNAKTVIIYSSMEDYRIEDLNNELKDRFPNYNIIVEHYSTGNHVAKLKNEGIHTEADIVLGLDSSYMESLKDNFEHLVDYDFSDFTDDLVKTKTDKKYFVMERFSGAIIINNNVFKAKGLDVPTSYADLVDEQYKNLIMMPNPKTSGTGYQFVLQLVNNLGENEAFSYFAKLSKNILQFTTNGSGPINSLIRGEIAVAMGMTFQAVSEINKGVPLTIISDPSGSPYSTTSNALIKGRGTKAHVKEVFDYIFAEYNYRNNEIFLPEVIYKSRPEISIPNYPLLKYGDMTGIDDVTLREQLLNKWVF